MRILGCIFAILLGKILLRILRLFDRAATTFPGRVALRFNPGLIGQLVEGQSVAVVTGTNGKTTTVAQICSILQRSGKTALSNASGANMSAGIATALIEGADFLGRLDSDAVVLEVDEAALNNLVSDLHPEIVVITNFFADQLDRYGQLDDVVSSVRDALKPVSAHVSVCLNADDPRAVELNESLCFAHPPTFFGVAGGHADSEATERRRQVQSCIRCAKLLRYRWHSYAHLGDYFCPACDFSRPQLDVEVDIVDFGAGESCVKVSLTRECKAGDSAEFSSVLSLPGIYNVYNAAAAVAAASTMGSPVSAMQEAVDGFRGVFGRWESFILSDGTVKMALVKNAAGFNQVLQSIADLPGSKALMLVLNDREADGRDISWIWDIQLEDSPLITRGQSQFAVGGERAADLALRLKYAGLPSSRLQAVSTANECVSLAEQLVGEVDELYVLPNYTAMWQLRREMLKRGIESDR